jgi:uncharacterized protein (DUF433 family)
MFAEAEAARLLRVPQSTLHYWLEGGERRGRLYRPIVRVEPTGRRVVTWGEFVESALLREYRRQLVPMAQLRAFIDHLREDCDVPFPLAHEWPYVSGRELVLTAQQESGLDGEYWLVAQAGGQLILTSPSASFVRRVTFDSDVATAWRPHEDPSSPVRMTPDIRFGRPAVRGVSTEVIWEHDQAGEDVAEIAEAFGLREAEVRWALAYETSARESKAA